MAGRFNVVTAVSEPVVMQLVACGNGHTSYVSVLAEVDVNVVYACGECVRMEVERIKEADGKNFDVVEK